MPEKLEGALGFIFAVGLFTLIYTGLQVLLLSTLHFFTGTPVNFGDQLIISTFVFGFLLSMISFGLWYLFFNQFQYGLIGTVFFVFLFVGTFFLSNNQNIVLATAFMTNLATAFIATIVAFLFDSSWD